MQRYQGILNWPASSLHPCFVKARPTVEEAVLLPSLCSVRHLQISCCKWGMLWTRLRTCACETLLPDVVVLEAHQKWSQLFMYGQRTYFSLSTKVFSMVGGYMEDIKESQSYQNRGWALAQDNMVSISPPFIFYPFHSESLCFRFAFISSTGELSGISLEWSCMTGKNDMFAIQCCITDTLLLVKSTLYQLYWKYTVVSRKYAPPPPLLQP